MQYQNNINEEELMRNKFDIEEKICVNESKTWCMVELDPTPWDVNDQIETKGTQ